MISHIFLLKDNDFRVDRVVTTTILAVELSVDSRRVRDGCRASFSPSYSPAMSFHSYANRREI